MQIVCKCHANSVAHFFHGIMHTITAKHDFDGVIGRLRIRRSRWKSLTKLRANKDSISAKSSLICEALICKTLLYRIVRLCYNFIDYILCQLCCRFLLWLLFTCTSYDRTGEKWVIYFWFHRVILKFFTKIAIWQYIHTFFDYSKWLTHYMIYIRCYQDIQNHK